eukprot:Skav207787  [mRNA]  locus=scaffold70:217087:217449:- [translate_table: standard]
MGCAASGPSGEDERVSPREPNEQATRPVKATPHGIELAEDLLELSPRRTVAFNDIMIYEACDAGNPEVKLVAVDSHAAPGAPGAPQKCLDLFLQTIEAAPQVLETKVANKRRRDFAFLEI